MKELVLLITSETNLPLNKAEAALETISLYVKEKYPLMAFAVDTVLETESYQKEVMEIQGSVSN